MGILHAPHVKVLEPPPTLVAVPSAPVPFFVGRGGCIYIRICIFSFSGRRQREHPATLFVKSVHVRDLPQAVSLGGLSEFFAHRAQHTIVRQRDKAQGVLLIGKNSRA